MLTLKKTLFSFVDYCNRSFFTEQFIESIALYYTLRSFILQNTLISKTDTNVKVKLKIIFNEILFHVAMFWLVSTLVWLWCATHTSREIQSHKRMKKVALCENLQFEYRVTAEVRDVRENGRREGRNEKREGRIYR